MVKHKVEMVVGSEAMKLLLDYIQAGFDGKAFDEAGLKEAHEEVSGAFKKVFPITSSLYIPAVNPDANIS